MTTGASTILGHLYLVIPVHNRCELTRKCLQAVFRQDIEEFTVVVIDDGSTDETPQMLQAEFPQVVCIAGDGNLWWTGATRAGVSYALEHCGPSDAIILLNDDLIVEPDYLRTIRKVALDNPGSLVGSVVLDINEPTRITDGGMLINWHTAKFQMLNQEKSILGFGPDHQAQVSTLTGRGVLIPVEAFDRVGLYNDDHMPQHGDMEWPVRASRAGYSLVVDYGCRVYCHHDLADDINEKSRYRARELRRTLTSQHSYLNVRERFWFAFHTRLSWPQFATFLVCDAARVGYHLARRLTW